MRRYVRRSAGSSITNRRAPLRAVERQRSLETERRYTVPRMLARIPLGRAFIIAALVPLATVASSAQIALAPRRPHEPTPR
jgi:hypothetical protein